MIPVGILAASGAAPAGAYELIQTLALGSSSSSVTFSSVPSTFRHLQLRMVTRNDRSAGNLTGIRMRFNGVSTASYSRHILQGFGSGTFSGASTSQTQIELDSSPTTATGTGIFDAQIVDILDYANTSKNKTVRVLSGKHIDITNQNTIGLVSGAFLSTAAISSITIDLFSNSFVAGTRVSLYGIKG